MYAKLDEQTPIFKVTPGKNCKMYPYLWTEECALYYGPNGDPKDNPFRCKAQGPVDPGQEYLGFPKVNFSHDLAGNPETCQQPPQ